MSGTQTQTTPPPKQSTYVERAITVTIQLGQGTFGQTGSNTVKLEGLRVAATINRVGLPGFGNCEIRVYGIIPSIMNAVSSLGVAVGMYRQNNIVTIEAGQVGQALAVVWRGYIQAAWQNLEGMPDTFLQIISTSSVLEAMLPGPPMSFPGPFDVAAAMSGLATRMGRAFVNDGVTVQLPSGYYPGTAMQQAIAIARAANIELDTGGAPGDKMTIWPKNRTKSGIVPLISVATGLVGYPQYHDYGIKFRCLFNPSIVFGGQIQMDSTLFPPSTAVSTGDQAALQAAGPNGFWYVLSPFILNLSSQMPGGPWFNELTCSRVLQP